MQPKTVVTSAIIVQPPPDLWTQIQAIRSKHDKAYARWMPHINLLYPFLPQDQFETAQPQLQDALKNLEPFEITFSQMNHFSHGKSCTLFLEPQTKPFGSLQLLQTSLEGVFPFCNDLSTRSPEGFKPHLTVAQFPNERETNTKKTQFLSTWKEIQFTVNEVYMIARTGNEPFKIIKTIPLGAGGGGGSTFGSQAIDQPIFHSTKPAAPVYDGPRIEIKHTKPDKFPEVCDSAEKWIKHVQTTDPTKLPKTVDKLANALKPRCRWTYSVGTPPEALEFLIQEGYVVKAAKGKVDYPKPEAHKNLLFQLQNVRDPSDVEKMKLRLIQWISSQEAPVLPKTEDKLRNSLVHIIVLTENVDPLAVIDYLETKAILEKVPSKSFGGGDSIVYK